MLRVMAKTLKIPGCGIARLSRSYRGGFRAVLSVGSKRVSRVGSLMLAVSILLTSCGSQQHEARNGAIPRTLLSQARPIGRGARFHPPATGPVIGRCDHRLGSRYGAHVEVFAANRVVLIAAGIGTRAPLTYAEGRISGADCYGDLVTLDPTGLVLVRPGLRPSLSELFRAWGQRLMPHRLASFPAPRRTPVEVFVNGHRWRGSPATVPLARHSEIVAEVGPYVPPHASYTFPPGT